MGRGERPASPFTTGCAQLRRRRRRRRRGLDRSSQCISAVFRQVRVRMCRELLPPGTRCRHVTRDYCWRGMIWGFKTCGSAFRAFGVDKCDNMLVM